MIIIFKIYLFYLNYTEGNRKKKNLPPAASLFKCLNAQGWARPKASARNSIQISAVVTEAQALGHLQWFSQANWQGAASEVEEQAL